MGFRVRFGQLLWIPLALLWLGTVVTGLGLLARYDNAPGAAARTRSEWPAGSRMVLDVAGPTLVMLAHPRCDCTRASMAELAELMARAHVRPKAYVVLIKPGKVPGGWENTDLWHAAAEIPGVTVLRDDDGAEASRFGAETSGQVFLYAAGGHILFSGGVTGARGHAGDNAGRGAILAILNQDDSQRTASPVFGCPLFAPGEARRSDEMSSRVAQLY